MKRSGLSRADWVWCEFAARVLIRPGRQFMVGSKPRLTMFMPRASRVDLAAAASHLSVVWCCRIFVFRWIAPTPAVAAWHAATPRGRHAYQRTSGGSAACHLC